MMGMFYLACLYGVLRGAQSPRPVPWYVAAVVACWLGMGTKEVTVTAPVVVLLYDRIFLADAWTTIVRRRGGVYAAFVPAVVAVLHASAGTMQGDADFPAGFGYRGVTVWHYLSAEPGVILLYLRLALWPATLCLDYMRPPPGSAAGIVGPSVVVLTVLAATMVALFRRPALAFAGLSFFLILALTSSVMPLADLAAEHRMYLPLASVVVLLVLAAHALACRMVRDGRTRGGLEAVALVAV